MGKRFWTTALLLSAGVIGTSIAGVKHADFSAQAEQVQTVQDTLIAPTSYEQYLPLSSPSDVAVSGDYTAIAQGNVIYVYNRTNGEYQTIDFSVKTNKPITQIQFYGTYLYCLDAGMLLYRADLQTKDIENISLACSNFLIHGETLFYTTSSGNMSTLYQTSIDDTSAETPLADKIAGLPSLAFWNGELYYTIDTQITLLFKINPQNGIFTQISHFPQKTLHDLSIYNGIVAFTVAETENGGDFYTYSIADFSEPITYEEGTFSSVTAYGDYFYTIEENSIKQYALQTQAFTDYEICGASNSRHRLDGAKATCLSGDTLYIADNGNKRISVYNTQTAQFETPIATNLQPLYLSAYENTLLLANQTTVEIYDTATQTLIQTWNGFTGEIIGAASVYGTQYVATNANHYYAITQDGVTEIIKTSTLQTPNLFTSDVYGNLYLLSGKKVYTFSESTLGESATTAELVCEFTTNETIQQIAVDYNQTLYALTNNKIIASTGEYTFESKLVYTTATPNVTAFAFDVLENTTYVLMDETYLLSTPRLQLPTVKTVTVETAGAQIFANASAEFSVLQTKPNALLVEFDITTLKNAVYFPYKAHNRAKQSLTALKIGETSTHYVIAHFNESKNAYQTYFVRKDDCTFMAGDVFRTDYAEHERSVLYVSSDVALYKFPYLTNLLTVTQLQRGAMITVLGEIRQLDNEYYQVQYTDANGTTLVGYIPKAFTNTFSGLPMPENVYQAGADASDTDAVWRLAYILLGFGAICILTDYLLLRKKKNENFSADDNNDVQI